MTSARRASANLMLVMIWPSVPRLAREAQGRRRKAVVAKLVDQGLLEEIRVKRGEPDWRSTPRAPLIPRSARFEGVKIVMRRASC